jgi:hypothetical protein
MWNIPIVPPAIFNERIAKCRSCKFFKKETGSCGTLITGQTVTHYRNKIRLCGCVMKWKAKYRFSSCPIGQWEAYNVSKKDIQDIRHFIVPLSKKSSLTPDEQKQLFAYFDKITGKVNPRTTCPPCVKSIITDILKEVNRLNMIDEGVVDTSQESNNKN